MAFELSEIKELRKKFGLTQTELANKAGVSQSLIAKVEAGKLDPTYTNAKKIFDALGSLSEKAEFRAEQIMNRKIIPIHPNEPVKKAIELMKKHEISQLPVLANDIPVGLISETTIINMMAETEPSKIAMIRVKDVMEECPPIVSKTSLMSAISNLLKYFPVVLVSESGKLIGLITKADILEKVYKG